MDIKLNLRFANTAQYVYYWKEKVLSLKQKLEVRKWVYSGVSLKKIAKNCGVSLSTIQDIYHSRRHLINFNIDTLSSCSSRKLMNNARTTRLNHRSLHKTIMMETEQPKNM
ncbi:hypothetical protein T06_7363 [Trichinella sp. T6]|nr:hypothetical protein T06_7363 [Trichinella sp. T6]